MKGKLFTEIQFELVVSGKKTSFWEEIKEKNRSLLPRYKVNEVLYLKEPYRRKSEHRAEHNISFLYKYGNDHLDRQPKKFCNSGIKWENKLFMPQAAARYFIQIINVRKETLKNIDCYDCIENGLAPERCHKNLIGDRKGVFVWVYEFIFFSLNSSQNGLLGK